MGRETLIDEIRTKLGDAVESVSESYGDDVLAVRPGFLRSLMVALRAAPFDYAVLLDLTCVDFTAGEGRFELVYHLYSLSRNVRLRLKTSLPAADPVADSITGLWKNADWLEREVFDMFGVRFTGHPDLRRLLTYEGFEGHPLRKSYPWRLAQPRIPMKDKV
ncbi:MAG: NADH-quinone oxidoreductase subunit C [Acidobacteria bacterium]|nr:NADH-quinone oxidoreductase subunit C [Acidobacteriota bacterium]MBE3125771.1 NADH-quinone oxidoreductase subunit C [Acidobacteriota bacterium]